MTELATKYGLPGIMIAGLCWFILKLMRDHRAERKEWKETLDKTNDRVLDAMDKNTGILQGLKTLLENRK